MPASRWTMRRPTPDDYRKIARTSMHAEPFVQKRWLKSRLYAERVCRRQAVVRELARSMGYKTTNGDNRYCGMIFADALTTLEKLISGSMITHRPRELDRAQVMQKIENVLQQHGGLPREQGRIQAETGGCTDGIGGSGTGAETEKELEILMAASKHILKLKEANVAERQRVALLGTVTASQYSSVAARDCLVENTLRQLEKWCNAWLQGDLADHDWTQIESCLVRNDL